MHLDLALISANAFSALAVTLMLLVLRSLRSIDKRVAHVESDLYINPKNPTSMPLTKQVKDLRDKTHNMKEEMVKINKNIEGLNSTIEKINNTVTAFCK